MTDTFKTDVSRAQAALGATRAAAEAEAARYNNWVHRRDEQAGWAHLDALGRRAVEAEHLEPLLAAERAVDAAVAEARALAARLLDAEGLDPATRFALRNVALTDRDIQAASARAAFIAEDVAAEDVSGLERIMRSALDGEDRGVLWAVARAVERRRIADQTGALASQNLRDLMDQAGAALSDPESARRRSAGADLATLARETADAVGALRRDPAAKAAEAQRWLGRSGA